jgi:nucleotide-binding universal stress UspA family protein
LKGVELEMTKLKHILVPTDGSTYSLKAAAFGGQLARSLDAQLTVLLVQDERSVIAKAWNTGAGAAGNASKQGSVEEARAAIEKDALAHELSDTRAAVGDVSAGVNVAQIWGHPAHEICRYAKENAVDLIVMGSHGRTGMKELLLGSISHAVVNTAGCAVTIVR